MKASAFTGTLLILIHCFSNSYSQKTEKIILTNNSVTAYGVTAKKENYKGHDALRIEQTKVVDGHGTFVLLKETDFHNGTIELNISGQIGDKTVEGARGFAGIVFRARQDTSKYEIIYIRPENGRANDQVRRNHSVQYVSHPGYHWQRMRKEFPEKYESYADLIPGEWTKIKIEVKDETAMLYINGSTQPVLIVSDLKQGKHLRGAIGLWVGPGTLGHFSDIKINKLD